MNKVDMYYNGEKSVDGDFHLASIFKVESISIACLIAELCT